MWHRSKAVLARRMRALCVVHRARGGVDRNIDSCETCLRQQVDPLRRQQRAICDQGRDHADLRSMSDDRRKIPMHERLTAGEVQKPNAVVNQDVGSKLCLIEGHGMPRRRGQPVARSCRNRTVRCRRWLWRNGISPGRRPRTPAVPSSGSKGAWSSRASWCASNLAAAPCSPRNLPAFNVVVAIAVSRTFERHQTWDARYRIRDSGLIPGAPETGSLRYGIGSQEHKL